MNGGRANVGTGTFTYRLTQNGVDLRQFLARFTAEQQQPGKSLYGASPLGDSKGYPLRTGLGSVRTRADRLLLAGDAAGLVNPM
ncbi:MAG: hypothetical protein AAGU05_10970, partial [Anaerolineaceae bacterium]